MTFTGTLAAQRVVTGWADLRPGWIRVADGVVVGCAEGVPSEQADVHSVGGTIIPGFVDIHVHGAVGFDFGMANLEGVRSAAGYHSSRGTTTLLASVASASIEDLGRAIIRLRTLVEDGTLAGIYLEGPYLSQERRGAHNPALLREPNLAEVQHLVGLGGGAIRMLTIAPELPGAEAVVRWLVDQGVVVAIGHTNCDLDTARAAFNWGATVATHLFNGMPELRHRNPGPVGAALVDPRITAELILDGHHVRREAAEVARRSTPGRLALVSDAMQATGQRDGDYDLAGSFVRVKDGVAMLADGSSLAGSTMTISDCFPLLLGLDDMTLPEAVLATSITPAVAIGIARPGLQPGASADLVVLGDSLETPGQIERVMRRGTWLTSLL
jgi:N-acetylglucosamine-6-phosphate deacetylase